MLWYLVLLFVSLVNCYDYDASSFNELRDYISIASPEDRIRITGTIQMAGTIVIPTKRITIFGALRETSIIDCRGITGFAVSSNPGQNSQQSLLLQQFTMINCDKAITMNDVENVTINEVFFQLNMAAIVATNSKFAFENSQIRGMGTVVDVGVSTDNSEAQMNVVEFLEVGAGITCTGGLINGSAITFRNTISAKIVATAYASVHLQSSFLYMNNGITLTDSYFYGRRVSFFSTSALRATRSNVTLVDCSVRSYVKLEESSDASFNKIIFENGSLLDVFDSSLSGNEVTFSNCPVPLNFGQSSTNLSRSSFTNCSLSILGGITRLSGVNFTSSRATITEASFSFLSGYFVGGIGFDLRESSSRFYGIQFSNTISPFYFRNGTHVLANIVVTETKTGIVANIADLQVLNGTFIDSTCESVITVSGGSLELSSTIISNNTYTSDNVAVLYSTAHIRNCTFLNNRGPGLRGALNIVQSTVGVQDSEFSSNLSEDGAAVRVYEGNVTVINSKFLRNTAQLTGGALTASYSTLAISDSSFLNNSAGYGGALYFIYSNFSFIYNSNISSNSADQNGGGFYFRNSTAEIKQCSISQNQANQLGGGVFISDNASQVLMIDNTILGNIANLNDAVSFSPEYAVRIVSSFLQQRNSTALTFCCNGSGRADPNNLLCSFPMCTATCREAQGCNCPFSVSSSISPQDPFFYAGNTTCTCVDNSYGPFCTEVRNTCDAPYYGGCDFRVTCQVTNNVIECGPCPIGFNGTGNTTCTTLCGDQTCDASVGETCVSCPYDCRGSNCGVCGDGVCSDGETCANCFADCRDSCPLKTCSPSCKNGTCYDGSCICNVPWSGPACDVRSESVVVIVNSTTPEINIVPDASNSHSFKIHIQTMTEVGEREQNISSVDLRDQNFRLIRNVSSASNMTWVYSATLSNRAMVDVTFIQFYQETVFSFANKSSTFSANTVKLNFNISGWPFKSIYNKLNIVMESSATGGDSSSCGSGQSTNFSSDSGGSLQWIKITQNGVAVYAQFVPDAMIDTRKREVKFSLLNNYSVVATLPHFWNYAELDPNYSILVDPFKSEDCEDTDDKKKRNNTKVAIIASVVSVVGVALIAATAGVLYRRHTKQRAHSRLVGMQSMSSQ